MLLRANNDNNVTRNECIPKNSEKLTLQFPFLITSTAARSKLQESVETTNFFLPSIDEPISQPKKRLPLNMVISAMAERERGLFPEAEETSSSPSKLKNLRENADESFQRVTFHRRCRKHRVDVLSNFNDNLEQTHNSSSSSSILHLAERASKYGNVKQDVFRSNFTNLSGSHNTPYSTPYARSRFQQLYGNGVRTDFHFPADTVTKEKSDSRCTSELLYPLAISDITSPNSNTYSCVPQEHEGTSNIKTELNTKIYQPFITSDELIEYADVPEELNNTSIHPFAQINDSHTDSTFNDNLTEDCEPATCFRVTYTKKNITYLNKHVQNNINITESHYEFIFDPKIIIEETGEQLSIPDLACK